MCLEVTVSDEERLRVGLSPTRLSSTPLGTSAFLQSACRNFLPLASNSCSALPSESTGMTAMDEPGYGDLKPRSP